LKIVSLSKKESLAAKDAEVRERQQLQQREKLQEQRQAQLLEGFPIDVVWNDNKKPVTLTAKDTIYQDR